MNNKGSVNVNVLAKGVVALCISGAIFLYWQGDSEHGNLLIFVAVGFFVLSLIARKIG